MTQLPGDERDLRQPVATISPDFKADAVRALAELRARGPVQRVRLGNGLDAWGVLSYEHAREALTHPALLHDPSPSEKALAAAASGSLEETEAIREQIDAANVRVQFASGK